MAQFAEVEFEWPKDRIRMFVSHRDDHRQAAKVLADELEQYGVAPFLAHADIPHGHNWQATLIGALRSMEVLLAFMTDDFSKSEWTQQEVGFAVAMDVPIIALRLGTSLPSGFLASVQAYSHDLADLERAAPDIVRFLTKALGERQRKVLIQKFVESANWNDARSSFDRMDLVLDRLSEDEVIAIIKGFEHNHQLNTAQYLVNRYGRFISFLNEKTGRKYALSNRSVSLIS